MSISPLRTARPYDRESERQTRARKLHEREIAVAGQASSWTGASSSLRRASARHAANGLTPSAPSAAGRPSVTCGSIARPRSS